MEILHQLGGLMVGSVPTAVLLVLLVALYEALVRRPLEATLAERKRRTSGAVDEAKKAIERAESETEAYEAKLRSVRAEIAAERERRLREWNAERERLLESARAAAQELLKSARAEIDSSSEAARNQIQDATGELSDRIVRAILPSAAVRAEATK